MRLKTTLIALTIALLFVGSTIVVTVSAQATPADVAGQTQAGTTPPIVGVNYGTPTTLTIGTKMTQIPKVDAGFTLYGQLLSGQTPRAAGIGIDLYRQKQNGTIEKIDRVYTGSSGYWYSTTERLPSAGTWYVWAYYAGNTSTGVLASSSSHMVMQVWSTTPPVKTPTNLVLWASSQKPGVNNQFYLTGYLNKNGSNHIAGMNVTISYKFKVNWSDPWGPTYYMKPIATNGNGFYNKTVSVTAANHYYAFYANFYGGTSLTPCTSNQVTVVT